MKTTLDALELLRIVLDGRLILREFERDILHLDTRCIKAGDRLLEIRIEQRQLLDFLGRL